MELKDVITMCSLNKESRHFLDDKHLWSCKTGNVFKNTFSIREYIENIQIIHQNKIINCGFRVDVSQQLFYSILHNKYHNYIQSYKMPTFITLRHWFDHNVDILYKDKIITIYMEERDVVYTLKKLFIHHMYAALYKYDADGFTEYYNLF